FCGIEEHRRTLSLAHNADFESIADPAERAVYEARNLAMGAHILTMRASIPDMDALLAIAREFNRKDAA
ncbi:MAG: S-methyl-5-thioribose kinase, partial [Roseicyclus sp.]